MTSLIDLKAAGNNEFAIGNFNSAKKIYTNAIHTAYHESTVDNDFLVALYSNRAACHLQLRDFQACIEDCTAALDFEPSHPKSIFRRAKAYNELEKFSEAFKDIRTLLSIQPSNKEAVILATVIKDNIQKHATENTPLARTLSALNSFTKDKSGDHSVSDVEKFLKSLIGIIADDSTTASEFIRQNGLETLERTRECYPELKHFVLKVITAGALHRHFAEWYLNLTYGQINQQPEQTNQSNLKFDSVCQKFSLDENDEELVLSSFTLFIRLFNCGTIDLIQSHFDTAFYPYEDFEQESKSKESRHEVKNEYYTNGIIFDISQCICNALSNVKGTNRVKDLILDVLTIFFSEDPSITKKSAPDTRNMSVEQRKKYFADKRHLKIRIKRRAFTAIQCGLLWNLFGLSDSEISFSFRQKIGMVFAKLLNVLLEHLKPDDIKPIITPLLESGDMVPTNLDISSTRKKILMTCGLFLSSDAQLGVWALQREKGISEVLFLLGTGDDLNVEIAMEVLCHASAHEEGRSLLTPIVENGTLYLLMDSSNPVIRAAAASCFTKLGLSAKALPSESDDIATLLNVAMATLKEDNQEKILVERAVEVISHLVTKTEIKEELVHGSNRCTQAIPRLVDVAQDGKSAMAYGIAYIFGQLSANNHDLRREMFADKDITMEQFDELQKITKTKNENEQETDTTNKCQTRIKKLVQLNVIQALVRLSHGASDNTKEQIALTLARIAVESSTRGFIITQGGFNVCIDIHTNLESKSANDREKQCGTINQKAKIYAAHCLGRSLITTDPSLLSDRQRSGCIAPLLWLLQCSDANDLMYFEALMGLTNVLSVDEDVKNVFVENKGISTVTYMMFNDNLMVSRAATECLCNIATHPKMLNYLQISEKMKLWVAFAQDFEKDVETSRAALGCLAMAIDTSFEVAKSFIEQNGAEMLFEIIGTGNGELIHRVLVIIDTLARFEDGVKYLMDHRFGLILRAFQQASQQDQSVYNPQFNQMIDEILKLLEENNQK